MIYIVIEILNDRYRDRRFWPPVLWWFLKPQYSLTVKKQKPLVLFQAAKANLEKAQSEMSAASNETSRAEVQISIEANEAIVKALE